MTGPQYLAKFYWGDSRWCVAKRLSNGEERIIARSMSETMARKVAKLLNADLATNHLTVVSIPEEERTQAP